MVLYVNCTDANFIMRSVDVVSQGLDDPMKWDRNRGQRFDFRATKEMKPLLWSKSKILTFDLK